MGFINLGRLNIRKRNSCASALVSLSDVQPPSVYKSHILNGPINKLYIFSFVPFFIGLLHIRTQAFDVPGVSEYAEASNMVRNRIYYMSQYTKYGC